MRGRCQTSRRGCDKDGSEGDTTTTFPGARAPSMYRYRRSLYVPDFRTWRVNGMARPPMIVRREGYHTKHAPHQSFARRLRKKAPWPQSC
jgi:hypothetical protein